MLPFGGEIFFVLKIAKMGGIRHFRSSTVNPDSSADCASLLRPAALRHCWITFSFTLEHCVSFEPALKIRIHLLSIPYLRTHHSASLLDLFPGALRHLWRSSLRITLI